MCVVSILKIKLFMLEILYKKESQSINSLILYKIYAKFYNAE